jgi:hypothetical protein
MALVLVLMDVSLLGVVVVMQQERTEQIYAEPKYCNRNGLIEGDLQGVEKTIDALVANKSLRGLLRL